MSCGNQEDIPRCAALSTKTPIKSRQRLRDEADAKYSHTGAHSRDRSAHVGICAEPLSRRSTLALIIQTEAKRSPPCQQLHCRPRHE
ncbi:hypothetical protein VZT92_017948 [Zoarces viviparus]|uniref:Uncharacterized protein n=1 Tax=Zoarces viviparus TaxID=48416 RepID=A0AAW1ENX4_ZOAVI